MNCIKIVDVSRSRYNTTSFNSVQTSSTYINTETKEEEKLVQNTNDCLGIFPVITTAANAIWMQQLFSSVSCDVISSDNYNAVTALTDVDPIDPTTVGINFT